MALSVETIVGRASAVGRIDLRRAGDELYLERAHPYATLLGENRKSTATRADTLHFEET